MKNPDDVLVIVQARLSSQRCPRKMIRPFAGTTLLDICLDKIVQSDIPKKNFYASLYDDELKEVANRHGVNIFHRSEESATADNGLKIIYEWHKLPYKYVMLVSACQPFLKVGTINGFYNAYLKSEHGGLFGVIERKTYYWNQEGESITPLVEDIMNTKTCTPLYEAGHVLYASQTDLISQGVWMGDFTKNSPALYPLGDYECQDIDYEEDFRKLEILYKAGF